MPKTGYLDTILELLNELNETELQMLEKEVMYRINEKYGLIGG